MPEVIAIVKVSINKQSRFPEIDHIDMALYRLPVGHDAEFAPLFSTKSLGVKTAQSLLIPSTNWKNILASFGMNRIRRQKRVA